ncbi:hypothetical protein EGM92_12760, partial [Enterobacter cloacae]
LAENTDDLFVGKTLLHGDVLMWLMKTLLTSRCINQRGAGHQHYRKCFTNISRKSSSACLVNLSSLPTEINPCVSLLR